MGHYANLTGFISITGIHDNQDGTFDVDGIVQPFANTTVQVEIFDDNGTPSPAGAKSTGPLAQPTWSLTNVQGPGTGIMPYCFVAQASDGVTTWTCSYMYPAVTYYKRRRRVKDKKPRKA